MELYLTVSTIAFLLQVPLWLFCPGIFDKNLGRGPGDRDSSVRNQNNVAQLQTLLAGLRESGGSMKGIDLGLEGQVGFQLTQNQRNEHRPQ